MLFWEERGGGGGFTSEYLRLAHNNLATVIRHSFVWPARLVKCYEKSDWVDCLPFVFDDKDVIIVYHLAGANV